MIIYEVNLTVDLDVVDEYAAWLRPHIAHILEIDGFLGAEWLERDSVDEMEIAKKCTGQSSIGCVTAPRSKPTSVTTRRRSSAKGRRASAAASAPTGECWSR